MNLRFPIGSQPPLSGSAPTRSIQLSERKDDADFLSDDDLRVMIAHQDPADMNVLGLNGNDPTRECEIIRYSPNNQNDQLEETVRAFVEGDGRPINDLGRIVEVNDDHFISLLLHREADGRINFRYYDPSLNAASREKLKEQVAGLLHRYGIDMEWHFTGVRQGRGKKDVNNCGIYAVLAMRGMLAGKSELNITTQEILTWRERVMQARETQAQQHEDSDAFMREIAGRTAHANKLAKKLAEQSKAISVALGYFPPRTAAQFQILNKRFYDHVIPSLMGELSFQDFPVKWTPFIGDAIWYPRSQDADQIEKLAQAADTTMTGEQILSTLEPGMCQQFLGWLLLSDTLPGLVSDPVEVHHLLNTVYQAYGEETHNPANRNKLILSHWLGNKLVPYYFMPGDGWKVRTIAREGNDRIIGIRFSKNGHMSIRDMFDDRPHLPDASMQEIHFQLDEAVRHGAISEKEGIRALSNLEPISTHFDMGNMVVDLVILPKMIDDQEKNYVYVECTSRNHDHLRPRQLFMAENIVLDEKSNIRLSDKLRKDIQGYFHKMGWDNCLGKTLRPKPEKAAAKTMHNQYAFLLKQIFLLYEAELTISQHPTLVQATRKLVEHNLEVIKEQMHHLAKDVMRYINPEDFKNLLQELGSLVSVITFCECSSEILKAIRELIARQAVPVQNLQNFMEILSVCRTKLKTAIKIDRINTADETVAYVLVNELTTTINELREKISVHEKLLKRLSERPVETLEMELHTPTPSDEMQIDTHFYPEPHPRSDRMNSDSGDTEGKHLRKRDSKRQEKALVRESVIQAAPSQENSSQENQQAVSSTKEERS